MKEGSAPEEKKEWAKLLYTRHDKTIPDIALEAGIEESVVRGWVQEGRWEGIRVSLLTSKANQLQHLYTQLDKLNARLNSDQEPNPKDADLLLKYVKSIKDLDSEPTVSEYIEIFEYFIVWLRRKNAALTLELISHFDEFVAQKIAA